MAEPTDGFSSEEIAAAQAELDKAPPPSPEPAADPAVVPSTDPAAESAEASPAPQAQTDDDDIPDVERVGEKRMVPVSALQKLRRERQEQAAEYAKLQGQVAAFQAAMQQLQQPAQPQQQPAAPPSIEEDPIGALQHTQRQLAELNNTIQSQLQAQQFQHAYVSAANAFSAQNPDFRDAYNFAIERSAAEYRVMGMNDQQIAQQLRADEMAMVQKSLQAGRNPAELIYNLAKAKGYEKKAAAPQQQQAQPLTPATQLAAKAAAANPIASGGMAPSADLSAAAVAAMNPRDPQFSKAWDKLNGIASKSVWRQ